MIALLRKITCASACVLAMGAMMPLTASAVPAEAKIARAADANEGTFYVGNYYYEIISKADRTVRFAYEYQADPEPAPYSGDVVVPETVKYDGVDYTVVEIGKFCFDDEAVGLKSVTLPSTIRKIRTYSFWGTVIDKLELPAGLEEIEANAFCNANIEAINIPGTCKTIGEETFQDCKTMETATLGEGIEIIPKGLFSGCVAMESLTLPTTIKSIGEYAFYECQALPEITIPDGVQTIDKYALARCIAINNVVIPNSVTSLGDGVFASCNVLTNATLPAGLVDLPGSTFFACAAMPSYTVPDGIKTIGDECFKYCMGLTEFTVSKDVETFGENVFQYCNAIATVTCKPQVPPTGVTFAQPIYETATLYVPADKIEDYRAAEGWKQFLKIEADPNGSGVDGIAADIAEAEYYTLQGVRTANPEHGIYLMRQGGKVTKVVMP